MVLFNCSKVLSFARFVFLVLALLFSFEEEQTSAEKLKASDASKVKVSVSTLSAIPVVSFVNGTDKLCTGALVGPKSVITSKQCLRKIKRTTRKRSFTVQIGGEISRPSKLITSKNLKVGLVQLRRKFTKTHPMKLYSISKLGFGVDFLVAGFGKKAEEEIGYLTAYYLKANVVQSFACFAKSTMPSLVRSPTAVVGIPTYGFGDCFFDSEVTFQNVGSKEVLQLVKTARRS